jgi:ribonuclease P protein subunit POP4
MTVSITPESILRHELNGLRVEIVASSNPDLVGIAGVVVGETTQTVRLDTDDGIKQCPKDAVTLEFELPSGELVTVDSARLVARPTQRSEQTGRGKWHLA